MTRDVSQSDALEIEAHGSGLCFAQFHEGFENAEHILGLFQAIGQGVLTARNVRWILHRPFSGTPQSCHWRAQIVSNTVERQVHGVDDLLIFVE